MRKFRSITSSIDANVYVGPFGEIVVDDSNTLRIQDNVTPGGITFSNQGPTSLGNYSFNNNQFLMPDTAQLNSGGIGITNAAEFGTEISRDGFNNINGSQIYMGAGTAESRAIVNSAGNTLIYTGVENVYLPGYAGMVAIDPGVNSQYTIGVDGNGNIVLGGTTSTYTAGIGVLNDNTNINGLYVDTNQTVISTSSGQLINTVYNNNVVQTTNKGGGNVYAYTYVYNSDIGGYVEDDTSYTHSAYTGFDAYIESDPLFVIDIQSGNTGISQVWQFDSNGNLTLPAGGTINWSDGSNALVGGSGNIGNFTFTGNVMGTTDSSNIQVSSTFMPSSNAAIDLGSATNQWRSLWISGQTIYLGGQPLGINAQGSLTLNSNVIATTGNITFNDTTISTLHPDSPITLSSNVIANIQIGVTSPANYWWNVYGDIGFEINENFGSSVVYDASGYLYVVGTIVDLSLEEADSFLLKYDPQGDLMYSKRWRDGQNLPACVTNDCIDIDSNGNIYFLANNDASLGFYVGSFDPQGDIHQQYSFGIENFTGYDMACDNAGNVYVAGEYDNSPAIVSINVSTNTINWNDVIDLPGNSNGVDVDTTGNVYVISTYSNVSVGWNVPILVKYDNNGNQLWDGPLQLVTVSNANVNGSMVAVNGNWVYTLVDNDDYECTVLTQHNPDGSINWQLSIDINGNTYGLDLNFDTEGNVYVTGETSDRVSYNLMIAKVTNSGSIVWQRSFGSETSNGESSNAFFGHRMGSVFQDRIAITGFTFTNVSYDNDTSNPTSNNADVITVQLPTDGSLLGTYGPYSYVDASYFNDQSGILFTPTTISATHGPQSINQYPSTLNPTAISVTENYSNRLWVISGNYGGTWSFENGALTTPVGAKIAIPDFDGQTSMIMGFVDFANDYGIPPEYAGLDGGYVGTFQNRSLYLITTNNESCNALEFDSSGNLTIPGSLKSTQLGISNIESPTDINLTAGNRVNIKSSPLGLATFTDDELPGIAGKPGDLIYNITNDQIETYVDTSWVALAGADLGEFVFTDTNMSTPAGTELSITVDSTNGYDGSIALVWNSNAFIEIDPNGVRVSTRYQSLHEQNYWQFNNQGSLAFPDGTKQTTAFQVVNINMDGGGASAVYELSTLYADGGTASMRFGINDTVFNGGASTTVYGLNDNAINGGGA